jgi:heat shock protein 5
VISCSILIISNKSLLKQRNNEPVIGIDLGNVNSCVGIYLNSTVEILKNEKGNIITPSIVAFTEEERLVGEQAEDQEDDNPQRTIKLVKRLLGRDSDSSEVRRVDKQVKYDIIRKGEKPVIEVEINNEKETFSPEQIAGMIFKNLKQLAEQQLDKKVKNAVIVVPASFDDRQNEAVTEAAKLAGLKVQQLVPGPIAAAAAYKLDAKNRTREILVFDMGGSALDVSILLNDKGDLKILANRVNPDLGGEDFNYFIREEFFDEIKKTKKRDLTYFS